MCKIKQFYVFNSNNCVKYFEVNQVNKSLKLFNDYLNSNSSDTCYISWGVEYCGCGSTDLICKKNEKLKILKDYEKIFENDKDKVYLCEQLISQGLKKLV